MEKNKKIQYGDTYLTFKNYKEPLREVEKKKGFGYYGAILVTLDGDKIQCHICGKLYRSLGFHVLNEHKITAHKYKERFKLSYDTALISETLRQQYKQSFVNFFKSMTEDERKAWRQEQLENLKKAHDKLVKLGGKYQSHPHQLETKNKRGTCPDQLLQKIVSVKEKLGRVPSLHEFVWECGTQRYKHLILTTFGSWRNALNMLHYESPKGTTKGQKRKTYTNEEILEYLRIYAEENRKIPTATDSRRGLIPDETVITRRFGSWKRAREIAGVNDYLK